MSLHLRLLLDMPVPFVCTAEPRTWVTVEGEGWQVAPHSSISMRR